MAKYGGADVGFLLISGHDVRGVSTTLRENVAAVMVPTHGLGDSWAEHTPTGRKTAELEIASFYDDAAGGIDALLANNQENKRIGCWNFENNTVGQPFTGVEGVFGRAYERVASLDDLHKVTGGYVVSGQVDQNGAILHTLQAETTASGNTEGNPVNNGASSANGGIAYLQVTGLTLGGYTSVSINVADSPTDVTYSDILNFNAVTAAQTAQRKAYVGTVEQYLAINWTFNGAGSGQSITFMVGFKRS